MVVKSMEVTFVTSQNLRQFQELDFGNRGVDLRENERKVGIIRLLSSIANI